MRKAIPSLHAAWMFQMIFLVACQPSIVHPQPMAGTCTDAPAVQRQTPGMAYASLTQAASASSQPAVTSTRTPGSSTAYPTATSTPLSYYELMKTHLVYYVTDPVSTTGDCKYYKVPVMDFPYTPRTGEYLKDISSTLRILFSKKELHYGSYNNLLAASDLEVTDLSRSGHTLHVTLYGVLYFYGRDDYCSDWQVRDQIVKTVEQFTGVLAENGINDIVYHMDNELLDDLLLHDLSLNTNP